MITNNKIDYWFRDEKYGVMGFTLPFISRKEAVAFAKKEGLSARCVKSRPKGYIVERPA